MGEKIGEVWFVSPQPLPLLVKYLFTSERLSVQVHPNDAQARSSGFAGGKTECWYILDAEPNAQIGLGLTTQLSPEELQQAAQDGSIEQLVHWRPVKAGEFLYVPPGTIHAIGAGITLLEFQQNQDVTYRLYDYGRPRELHIREAANVANAMPYPPELSRHVNPGSSALLVQGEHFKFAHARADSINNYFLEQRRWVVPLEGEVRSGDHSAKPGDCLVAAAGEPLHARGRFLIGAEA
ncbi:class I mannose-6-phosphate isomerase [Sphingomonas piscis]|nr:class I mannose-6-phosphate isomerase [Sphingomonas piscis]